MFIMHVRRLYVHQTAHNEKSNEHAHRESVFGTVGLPCRESFGGAPPNFVDLLA